MDSRTYRLYGVTFSTSYDALIIICGHAMALLTDVLPILTHHFTFFTDALTHVSYVTCDGFCDYDAMMFFTFFTFPFPGATAFTFLAIFFALVRPF